MLYIINLCFCLCNCKTHTDGLKCQLFPTSFLLLVTNLLRDILLTSYLGSSTQYEIPSAGQQEIEIHVALRRNCVGVTFFKNCLGINNCPAV